jgi:glycosyltransferase involved in cell wall biosynthesis
MMNLPEVSLVFPAYNEEEGIEKAVTLALEELGKITPSFEIIVAEDGSSDGTGEIANRLSDAHPKVRYLHSTERLGRGRALNRAFKEARGAILVYMDVDLATDIHKLGALIESIRSGADLATGSRMLPDSRVRRSTRRSLASWFYNTLIRTLFRTSVHDHQCGFKAFNRARLIEYLDEVEDNHWFWDTEVLIRGARRGLKVVEVPVDWTEGRGTKVKLLRDSWRMGSKAIHLWWKLNAN